MFKVGDSYKVKVEFPNGHVGYGRASILDKAANHFFVIVRSNKDAKEHPPVGSRIYLVGSYQDNAFNGLWSAKVVGEKIIDGATTLEIGSPKFTPVQQRRKANRVSFDCPVMLTRDKEDSEPVKAVSKNISTSGIAIEADERLLNDLMVGECVAIKFKSKFGTISAKCRTVRTEYNWLAHRSDAGFEFVELEPDQKDRLERLLDSLGAYADAPSDTGNMPKGLAGWIKGAKSNTSLVKKIQSEPDS